MRRALKILLPSVVVLGLLAGAAESKPDKPPKPKPSLTLLTGTEQGVLRREMIKVRVDTNRGKSVRVTNHFVVDGYPADFPFDLRPQTEQFRDRTAVAKFKLSARQLEVLDFAIKTCRGATVNLRAEVGRGSGALTQSLAIPRDCADTG